MTAFKDNNFNSKNSKLNNLDCSYYTSLICFYFKFRCFQKQAIEFQRAFEQNSLFLF